MKKLHLPAIDDTIHRLYNEHVDELDGQIERLSRIRPRGLLRCRPGCGECCMAFSVVSLEAAHIRRHCPTGLKGEAAADHCAFLENRRCTIYDCRPLLCRTQGMAIGYMNDAGAVEVSACPLNFSEDFVFTEETILFMDAFNARLAELNHAYCRQAGLEARLRIPLSQLRL